MLSTILPILIFCIAVLIGTFLGKIIFSSTFKSEKIILEEKNNALQNQNNYLKEQFEIDKKNLSNQIQIANNEKSLSEPKKTV